MFARANAKSVAYWWTYTSSTFILRKWYTYILFVPRDFFPNNLAKEGWESDNSPLLSFIVYPKSRGKTIHSFSFSWSTTRKAYSCRSTSSSTVTGWCARVVLQLSLLLDCIISIISDTPELHYENNTLNSSIRLSSFLFSPFPRSFVKSVS